MAEGKHRGESPRVELEDSGKWVEVLQDSDGNFIAGVPQHRASTADDIKRAYREAGIFDMDNVKIWHEPENRAWGKREGRGDWRWVEESNRKGNLKRLIDGESVNLSWGEALGWLMAAVLVGAFLTAVIGTLILAGSTTR